MNNLESRLRYTVESLCKSERNTTNCPAGLDEAAAFLVSSFLDLSLRPQRQEFQADGIRCANVEAFHPYYGGHCSPHLIIGAHYDSAPGTVGADDNASAVAVLLEVARLLKDDPAISRIRFVAYANEEPPHFTGPTMGSRVHAEACRANGDQIAGMICLESLGVFTETPGSQSLGLLGLSEIPEVLAQLCRKNGVDPQVGNFLAIIGNNSSKALMNAFDSAYHRDVRLPAVAADFMGEFLRLSDHLSYWDAGYPAIMLTDTAMCRNIHYHRATDTPEKLNYPVMALLTERVAGAARVLANNLSL